MTVVPLDRARLAGDLGAGGAAAPAGTIDVIRFQGDVAVGGPSSYSLTPSCR